MFVRRMTLADCDALEPLTAQLALGVDPRLELARDLTRGWVALDAEARAPIGYALGWWVIDELQLLAVGTSVTVRRRGVARALLEHMITEASAAGAVRVTLEVGAENAAALKLYESAGFRTFNVRKSYYGATGQDALEMELVLPRPRLHPPERRH